jgi:hypothetical protein
MRPSLILSQKALELIAKILGAQRGERAETNG